MTEEWYDPDLFLPVLGQPVVVEAGVRRPAQFVREPYLGWRTPEAVIAEPRPCGVADRRWVYKWRPLTDDEIRRGLVRA